MSARLGDPDVASEGCPAASSASGPCPAWPPACGCACSRRSTSIPCRCRPSRPQPSRRSPRRPAGRPSDAGLDPVRRHVVGARRSSPSGAGPGRSLRPTTPTTITAMPGTIQERPLASVATDGESNPRHRYSAFDAGLRYTSLLQGARHRFRHSYTESAMPIYEYRCERGHTFEVMQRMTDDPLELCEEHGRRSRGSSTRSPSTSRAPASTTPTTARRSPARRRRTASRRRARREDVRRRTSPQKDDSSKPGQPGARTSRPSAASARRRASSRPRRTGCCRRSRWPRAPRCRSSCPSPCRRTAPSAGSRSCPT